MVAIEHLEDHIVMRKIILKKLINFSALLIQPNRIRELTLLNKRLNISFKFYFNEFNYFFGTNIFNT